MSRTVRRPDWALILGGARCVWTDVVALERMVGPWPGLVIAVNDAGCRWVRPLDHWVSLHPDKWTLPSGWRNPRPGGPHGWEALRRLRGYPGGYVLWSHIPPNPRAPARRRVVDSWGGGSSGLLAVAVAYELGCRRVALAGVPLTAQPHFDQSTVHKKGRRWASFASHRRPWLRHLNRLRTRVRSPSGWTRRQLGAPDREWFLGA